MLQAIKNQKWECLGIRKGVHALYPIFALVHGRLCLLAEFSAQNLGGVFFCETIVNVVSIHVDALGLQLESGAIGTAWLIMIILSIVV